MSNKFPRLHNAMWPGLVGKGSPGAEPFISLDHMLGFTKNAVVNAFAEVYGAKIEIGMV